MPLISLAIMQGDIDIVSLLLENGADVNAEDQYFETPLMYAVEAQNKEIVALLIEKGADVNASRPPMLPGRDIPLIELALQTENQEIIDLLLQAGASESKVRAFYEQEFYRYLSGGNVTEAQALLTQGKINFPSDTLVTLACYERGGAEVREFIRKYGPQGIANGSINLLESLLPGSFYSGVKNPSFIPNPQFPLATNFLHDEDNAFRYAPDKAFDGDLKTSWVEGAAGAGIGEKIAFRVERDIETITIVPGYGQEEYFTQNNRLKKVRLRFYTEEEYVSQLETELTYEDTGYEIELTFEDSMTSQTFAVQLPDSIDWGGVDGPEKACIAVLEIVEIYQGTTYDDTCIAEISF